MFRLRIIQKGLLLLVPLFYFYFSAKRFGEEKKVFKNRGIEDRRKVAALCSTLQ
jgi:hypothetical protein